MMESNTMPPPIPTVAEMVEVTMEAETNKKNDKGVNM